MTKLEITYIAIVIMVILGAMIVDIIRINRLNKIKEEDKKREELIGRRHF